MRMEILAGPRARFGGPCLSSALAGLALALLPLAASAQDAAPAFDRGDVAWMLTSTLLVPRA